MAKKKANVETCVVSRKGITQKHIDSKKVIDWKGGKAFIKAIVDSVPNPPENPIVLSVHDPDLKMDEFPDKVYIPYQRYNFPRRIEVKGKQYKSLPTKIFLKDTCFQLVGWTGKNIIRHKSLGDYEDGMVLSGVSEYQKVQKGVDTEDKV